MRPIVPDGTGFMSSPIINVLPSAMNLVGAPALSAVWAAAPSPRPSELPSESTIIIAGACCSSPALTSGDHIVPDEIITFSVAMLPLPASSAFRIGRAKASPTITA